MAARNPQLAALVRQRGGDGLLLSSDITQVMGSMSTASATATSWGSATSFGNVTNFSGGANAFGTGMTVPILRREGRSTSSNTSISSNSCWSNRGAFNSKVIIFNYR